MSDAVAKALTEIAVQLRHMGIGNATDVPGKGVIEGGLAGVEDAIKEVASALDSVAAAINRLAQAAENSSDTN